MRVSADLAAGRVTLAFDDVEAVRAFFEEARKQRGFVVPLGERPQPFAVHELEVTGQAGFELRFAARVVQIFEAGGQLLVAYQLVDWAESRELELVRKLAAAAAEISEVEEGEVRGTSPIFRIKQLDPAQRMQLAIKADRAERQILCRDTSPQVLLGLLSNPRLEAEDVLAIVKSNHATAGLLQRVAKERRWMSNAEIRTAVVRNPKTPTPVAVQLLESLPMNELRAMAKMGSIREDVRRAAFRVLQKTTSRR